jgi:hypothetical protein
MDLTGLHAIGHSQSCCTDMGFMEGVGGFGASAGIIWPICLQKTFPKNSRYLEPAAGAHALVVGSSDDILPLSVDRYHFFYKATCHGRWQTAKTAHKQLQQSLFE